MPNWCNTNYKVTGKAENVARLASVMKELGEMSGSGLLANGFGPTWLGNLIAKEGGDPNAIRCRGEWSLDYPDQPVSDGVLSFSVMSAWSEMEEWRHFVERKFDVKVYYLAEEFGAWVFQTNDREHRFFSDEYYFSTDFAESSESDYYSSLEALIASVQNVTGATGLSSFEDCESALNEYQRNHDSFEYFLIQISIVEN